MSRSIALGTFAVLAASGFLVGCCSGKTGSDAAAEFRVVSKGSCDCDWGSIAAQLDDDLLVRRALLDRLLKTAMRGRILVDSETLSFDEPFRRVESIASFHWQALAYEIDSFTKSDPLAARDAVLYAVKSLYANVGRYMPEIVPSAEVTEAEHELVAAATPYEIAVSIRRILNEVTLHLMDECGRVGRQLEEDTD